MKKTLTTLILLTGLIICSKAQSANKKSIRLVYNSTTTEAMNELDRILSKNPENKELLSLRFQKADLSSKIILSSEQYAPIRKLIDLYDENPKSLEPERATYVLKAKKRYVCVTNLTK